MDYDVFIAGAGAVGLAIASKLSKEGFNVIIAERHSTFGKETSSRNSEVIHAGIYYPKDSLKAILCVQGNKLIYEHCQKHKVAHSQCGKYIVATNKDEQSNLENIYKKAIDNSVSQIRFATEKELKDKEPHIKSTAALFSPSTGILDTHQFMASLEFLAKENGCDFAYKHEFIHCRKTSEGYLIELKGPDGNIFSLESSIVINCAGLDSDLAAERSGFDIERLNYRLRWCKGHYFRIRSNKKHLAKHLIYPVPPKHNHGLGIHVTIDTNGELKLGPDTLFMEKREQDYSVNELLSDKFYFAASDYISGLEKEDIYADQSGIRPKLAKYDGDSPDFIIREESRNGMPGYINLIGIESPGLTSSLAIANYVTEMI